MEDRRGSEFTIGCAMMLVIPLVIGYLVYDATIGQSNRCEVSVLQGEVRRLDWSGGWSSGVLIEFDTGSRIVRGRGHLPAVGDRAYVCKNNHAHRGSPEPR